MAPLQYPGGGGECAAADLTLVLQAIRVERRRASVVWIKKASVGDALDAQLETFGMRRMVRSDIIKEHLRRNLYVGQRSG